MQRGRGANLTRRDVLSAGAGLAVGVLSIDRLATHAAAAPAGPGVGIIQGISSFTGGDGSFKRVLREGIVIGWGAEEPFAYVDPKTKEIDGIDIRIMKKITETLGIEKVTWVPEGTGGSIQGLLAKRYDTSSSNIHENAKRLKVVDFTSPAYWYGASLAVRKGNPKNIHGMNDLAGKVAGAVASGFDWYILSTHKELKELKSYPNTEAEFADLVNGRLDVVMEDEIAAKLFMKHHPGVPMELATGYNPLPEEYGYARYGIRKEDIDLNHAISRAISELRGARDGIPAILEWGGLSVRNMWYWPK